MLTCMNKYLFAALVVAVLIIGAWFAWNGSGVPLGVATQESATSTPAHAEPTSPKRSANTINTAQVTSPSLVIFNQTGSHQCIFNQTNNAGRNNNIIDIANGTMRGEFRSTIGDKTTSIIMIYNGGYLYTWTEGMTNGTKTRIASASDVPAIIPRDLTSGVALSHGIVTAGWDCHAWITDPSLLTPPSYVKF